MSKKTPWFPPHIKPVREGVYQIRTDSGVYYSYWKGLKWAYMSVSVTSAEDVKDTTSWIQDRSWRGLTEKTT